MQLEPNAVNFVDRTTSDSPLYVAASANHDQLARELVKLGADPNRRDERGMTPLVRPIRAFTWPALG